MRSNGLTKHRGVSSSLVVPLYLKVDIDCHIVLYQQMISHHITVSDGCVSTRY